MPDLIPVDHDPWADATEPTPPDRLPSRFGAPRPDIGEKVVGGMAKGIAQQVMTPGIVAQPQQPETPGMWSDVDEAKRLATESAATDWGPATALNMIRTGTQMTPEGAVGVSGGKPPIPRLAPSEAGAAAETGAKAAEAADAFQRVRSRADVTPVDHNPFAEAAE